MFKYLFLFVVFFSSFSHIVRAKEEIQTINHIYVAIAGPESGLGQFGHAFAMFSKRPWNFQESIFYQYALDFSLIPDQLNPDRRQDFSSYSIKELYQIYEIFSDSPLVVSKGKGLKFIQKYQSEFRNIVIYKLDLTREEISLAHEEFENDYKNFNEAFLKNSSEENDLFSKYHILKNNCATVLLRKLNGVLEKTRGKPLIDLTLWDEYGRISFDAVFSKKSILSTVPIFLSKLLDESGYVIDKDVYRPQLTRDIELLSNFNLALKKVFNSCSKNELSQVYTKIFGNIKLRNNEKILKQYHSDLKSCKNSSERNDFSMLIALSIFMTKNSSIFSDLR